MMPADVATPADFLLQSCPESFFSYFNRRRLMPLPSIYRVDPVQWGKYALHLECTVRDATGYTMRMHCFAPATGEDTTAAAAEQQWEWEGTWGEERALTLPVLQ